jgi:hypothetical protein
MGWIEDVTLELARASEAQKVSNAGRARTSARRAVGHAISELQKQEPERYYGEEFIRQLRSFAEDGTLPEDIRAAAGRLQARLTQDFKSASEDPIADALTIINYIRDQLA